MKTNKPNPEREMEREMSDYLLEVKGEWLEVDDEFENLDKVHNHHVKKLLTLFNRHALRRAVGAVPGEIVKQKGWRNKLDSEERVAYMFKVYAHNSAIQSTKEALRKEFGK